MSVMELLADYKAKSAERKKKEEAQKKEETAKDRLVNDSYLSNQLNELRDETEQRADKLIVEYSSNPDQFKRELFRKDTISLVQTLLELNCEFPDAFTRPFRGKISTLTIDGNLPVEEMLRENLIRVLEIDLALVKARYQSQRSSYKASDGYKYNSAYRSIYLQLKALARLRGETLATITINLPTELSKTTFNCKTKTNIKNAFRRALADVLGEYGKYAAFSIECSKKGIYHLHGITVLPMCKKDKLQKRLRKFASSARNSVNIDHQWVNTRLMSIHERNINKAGGSNASVQHTSSVTCGFSDYISKDLGKRIGNSDVISSIVTISPGHNSNVDYAAYRHARHQILSICANRINEEVKSFGFEEIVHSFVRESPIYRTLVNLMTSTNAIVSAA